VIVEVRPRWAFALPLRSGPDGLTAVRAGVLHRLLEADPGEPPVLVRVAQPSRGLVVFSARASSRATSAWAIEQMRRALGVDQDLRPFYERFRFDPLIGRAVRANPGLRVWGKPEPFEALAWAISEQLIEIERAYGIQRRLVFRLGRRCERTELRAAPTAAVVARQAPALLASCGLSESRASLLVRVAREVDRGRIDLRDSDQEANWRRLRAIPGIGSWTVQMLGLTGQGRLDQIPAGDLGFLKLVGRLLYLNPRARATEQEVMDFFARFHPWAGLAGAHLMRAGRGSRFYARTSLNSSVSHGASASAARRSSSLP
jgi:3-methyladenine DNA glycosylase/8-oxoguanine DNA glycosylase